MAVLRVVPALAAACLVLACGEPGQGGSAAPGDGAGAPGASGAAATVPADSIAVQVGAFLLRYVEATEEQDTAALRAMLASDRRFVWMEDGAIRYRSPEEVLEGLRSFPPGMAVRTVLGEVEAAPLAGSAVHAWTPFSTTVGEGDDAFSFSGMLSFVLEPAGDGWRIVGGHTSASR